MGNLFLNTSIKANFKTFYKIFFAEIDELSQSNEREIAFDDCEFLKGEDKSLVEDYFKMLGKGDSASQKTYFSAAKEGITKLYSDAENEYKKYGDLYIKLGFLCGLLILILII